MLNIRPIVKGILTFIPGLQKILPQGTTGGTNSAAYCYGVWLKHLTLLWENGLSSIPNTLAELGPGDSIGIGLAAMLSGINNYYALDVVRFANTAFNLKVFDELVTMFQHRAGRPTKGWPDYDSYLDGNLFPSHILTEETLAASLSVARIALIRAALINPEAKQPGITIKYMVPWSDKNVITEESVDVILSHSVLEHVVDIANTYPALYLWLKHAGLMSHQIDFTAHGLSEQWNGYRAYPEWLWKLIVGRRPFLINRQPCSEHIECIKKNHFKIICLMKNYKTGGIARSQLSSYWKNISDDDLACAGIFVQAQKQ
jgi:hypothetical protein